MDERFFGVSVQVGILQITFDRKVLPELVDFDPLRLQHSMMATGAAAGVGAQAIVFLCVLAVFWIGLYPPNVIDWANSASQYLLQML